MDLKRAYDSVNRAKLWKVLVENLAVPEDLVNIIRNMYVKSKGIIPNIADGSFLEFLANIGVK